MLLKHASLAKNRTILEINPQIIGIIWLLLGGKTNARKRLSEQIIDASCVIVLMMCCRFTIGPMKDLAENHPKI